jgi:hypothetical protein
MDDESKELVDLTDKVTAFWLSVMLFCVAILILPSTIYYDTGRIRPDVDRNDYVMSVLELSFFYSVIVKGGTCNCGIDYANTLLLWAGIFAVSYILSYIILYVKKRWMNKK